MENLDRELQSRVWQRVQRREAPDMPPLGTENLKPLLLMLQENSQAYQQLASRLPGAEGEKLKQLRQESQKCIRCLKGIAFMAGEKVKVPQLPMEKEPVKKMLMKCCRRERELWNGFAQRAEQPEFGIVYAWLARQAGERYAALLELLGNLEP